MLVRRRGSPRSALGLAGLAFALLAAGCGVSAHRQRDSAPLPPLPIDRIRGITYLVDEPLSAYLHDAKDALPDLRAAGFNTVWLVLPWWELEPRPLDDPPAWDEDGFGRLRALLDAIAARRMHAIVGLDYLGRGWSPEGIDPCGWVAQPRMERAFEDYVRGFLERIRGYDDVVFPLLFTETALPCSHPYARAVSSAATLRRTLGSLPSRLPRGLRAAFRIGYHDNTLINLGWADGRSPIASPREFDFLSFTAYGLERESRTGIARALAARVGRFRALYPRVPLLIGELGASRCAGGAANQARVDVAIVSWALRHRFGFNVWHWRPVRDEDTCRVGASRALSLTSARGKPEPALRAVERLLGAR